MNEQIENIKDATLRATEQFLFEQKGKIDITVKRTMDSYEYIDLIAKGVEYLGKIGADLNVNDVAEIFTSMLMAFWDVDGKGLVYKAMDNYKKGDITIE